MTDFEKIFGVVNKLDRKYFDVNRYTNSSTGGAFLEVYRIKNDTEINFEFNEKGTLIDIWAIK